VIWNAYIVVATVVLVLVAAIVGVVVWLRARRKRGRSHDA
jgi:hypothetical protein